MVMRVSEEPVHVERTVVGLDPKDKGRPVLDPPVDVQGRAGSALLGLFDSQSAPGPYALVSIQYEAGQDEAAISSLQTFLDLADTEDGVTASAGEILDFLGAP